MEGIYWGVTKLEKTLLNFLCGVFKHTKKSKKFAGPKTLRQIFEHVVKISRSEISLEIDDSKTRKRFCGKFSSLPQLAAMVEWLERKENFNFLTGKATSGMKATTGKATFRLVQYYRRKWATLT